MGRLPNRALRYLLLQADREVAGHPVEYAIAYDALGNEVLRNQGTVDHVPLSPEEQKLLRGTIIVHNHPRETLPTGAVIENLPPSVVDDLDILLACRVKEIRVITRDYRFVLKARTDSRYPTAAARLKAVRRSWTRTYNKLRNRRLLGLQESYGIPLPDTVGLDFAEKIPDDAHLTWSLVFQKANLIYRRELL